jgi:hypothetical protein
MIRLGLGVKPFIQGVEGQNIFSSGGGGHLGENFGRDGGNPALPRISPFARLNTQKSGNFQIILSAHQ